MFQWVAESEADCMAFFAERPYMEQADYITTLSGDLTAILHTNTDLRVEIEFHGRRYVRVYVWDKRATETDLPLITDGYLPLIGSYVDQFDFVEGV